jgi:hypothetical protein
VKALVFETKNQVRNHYGDVRIVPAGNHSRQTRFSSD